MSGAERYNALINTKWPAVLPACSRVEAERAARRLYRKFGKREYGGIVNGQPVMSADLKFMGDVRKCWITLRPTKYHRKGWPRLVHDVSHMIHRRRSPESRPHGGGHAYLEAEMTAYVLAHGWLNGKLRPPTKAKPTSDQRKDDKRARLTARLKTWESKAKRAEHAIKKIRAALKRIGR